MSQTVHRELALQRILKHLSYDSANTCRLVDNITSLKKAKDGQTGTLSAILGPFWRADTPWRENGSTITFDTPSDGVVAYLSGKVTSAETGKPISNASVDVWQASTNGTPHLPIITQCSLEKAYKY